MDPAVVLKGKKRGTQRTPVRQKMKTMSRSLQMLNVARFNVKAQKSQTESDFSSSAKGRAKRGKRCSRERTRPGPMHFKNEEELLSHLNLRYQQAVEHKSLAVIAQVQDLLSVVETFIDNIDTGASFLNIIKKNLLKSTQSIRQLYGTTADAESKITDCQLQVVLRLELCKSLSSDEQDHMEQMVEEVAGMLRVISLTKDPVYLSKFMEEEVLPLYLTGIPKVLADVYHSLGTQLPAELVAVLPADFFSDDSMAKESVSVSPSPVSATQSLVSSVDQLEELRNRSAKKRRTSMLTRHKSMTEAPQNIRQIEMPRKSTQAKPKDYIPQGKLNVGGQPSQKQTVQEVTKVRRNLFNQEIMSSSKKAKMLRSRSVSAVDIMKKRKLSQMEDGQHTLLTKKVSETPLHKQVSNRLLYRQRNSRNSGDTDPMIVEESPVKPATDLRRSPRIKKLARRHSSVFYSSSQARSRNLDRALSSSQLPVSESTVVGDINIKAVKSPMRLLFGAAASPARPSTSKSIIRDAEVDWLGSTDSVFKNCNKTPRKSPYNQLGCAVGSRTQRTPSSSSKAQSCFFKSPGCAVGENSMVHRGSPFRSPASKSLVLETPKKSPLKSILKTPVKSSMECGSPSGPSVRSPNMRTPRKSVTWSPSPWKGLSHQPFKVPDSPVSSIRYSPRLITPSKLCRGQGDIFKTPEKLSQEKNKLSPKTTQRVSEITRNVGREETQLSQMSEKIRRTLSLPEKGDPQSPDILSYDHPSPLTPRIKTPSKSPGPTHTMYTRSGRTPLKLSSKGIIDGSSSRKYTSSLNKERSPEPTLRWTSSGSHTPVQNHPTTLSDETEHNQALYHETTKGAHGQNESIEMMEEASSSDTQQFDSSQFSATSIEESIDIAEASVVKTELTGGIKMNISFSRKSSKFSEIFEFTGTPTRPAKSMQGCSRYGFRQTPDRQQRKAAARLGYSPGLPTFRPQASGTPAHRKKQPDEPNPLTYQVELEMQASGLPKLKFKRTDSFNLGETSDNAAKGLVSHINNKPSRVDSPLTHCSKHREPSCISPSHCTPGKGGVQKYICQSITPTRLHTNSPSPLGPGEHMSWTPSPQSLGRSTPENFRTWPRKKRARTGLLGTKEIKEGAEILEDPELDGVFKLPGTEEPINLRELQDLRDAPAFKHTLGIPSKLCSSEEIDWVESVVQNCDKRDMKCVELSRISGNGSLGSVVTPPHSTVKKPVSASGILALTQSPLLYKGKKASVTMETTQSDESSGNSEQYGNKGMHTFNVLPISQPRRRQDCVRMHSRKRLLDPEVFDEP
ncbi:hypothetical protein AMELA_G00161220 [Ameiurus melas]|uniref:Treslin STD domain-containing protein n=1 Tax=Ameiurus melas TaxID=219545 RepID=A0A7J6AIU3_AMEME|nr:hypothetical protein AMELA_G00161220 [Ameiurus melas]